MPPPAPAAYAAAPGAPGGPGYGTTQGAPPPAGGYFKSGKNKTIALIVGGVVAIGVIGGVAAMLAGGGDSKDEVTTTTSAPQGSGVLDPAPVENTDPAPTEPGETTEPAPETTAPAPETTAPAPEPEPEPEPAPAGGDSVVIAGNIAVPVLAGWEVFGSDEGSVSMGKGNDFIFATTGTVEPSTDAGQLLSEQLTSILPPESYTNLATSDVLPQQPGGSIVSVALIEYEATWTDGQGTVPIHGVMFAAVRQDGTAMIILGEHTPPKEFGDVYEQLLAPTLGGALNSMAGVG